MAAVSLVVMPVVARAKRKVKAELYLRITSAPLTFRLPLATFCPTSERIQKFSSTFRVVSVQKQFVQDQWATSPSLETVHQSAF